jgi:hypothetical protein
MEGRKIFREVSVGVEGRKILREGRKEDTEVARAGGGKAAGAWVIL